MDLFGARTVISEAVPIFEVALPFVGIGIILVVPLAVAEYLKHHAIQELEELQRCGEELVDWAARAQPEMQPLPRSQSRLRYIILVRKYKRWLKEPVQNPSVGDSIIGAAECAETLRAYGYMRGRFTIWRDRRQWNRMTASARTVNAEPQRNSSPVT